MYLSFGISKSLFASSFCESFEDFDTLIISFSILLPIKTFDTSELHGGTWKSRRFPANRTGVHVNNLILMFDLGSKKNLPSELGTK